MKAMAYKFLSYLKSHPLITAISLLLLFTLPILHMLMFFWPLIVSTVLGVLAVISFGRQSDEHAPPISGCGSAEIARQPDLVAFPSHEENISNVLMVGNQEVTWLEWLHNEDTQKLCAEEREPAVWDAYWCDGSTMASGFTCIDEAIDDAYKGRQYARVSRGEGETHVSARVVSTEENEPMAVVPPSPVLGGFIGTAIVIEEEETKMMNAPILTAEDESNLDLTGADHTCRCGTTMENDITFIGNREISNTDAPACAEGDEGHFEGLCLPRGGGNECKAMQGSLDSTIHTKNEVNGYPSAVEDEVAGIVESTNECNAHISHTSELKTAHTHEQDAADLQISNKTMSPVVEVKGAKVHEMWHVQQDQAERGSNPFETQDPQWDVSDGEEDRSSLRFSFFHNSSLTPSEA